MRSKEEEKRGKGSRRREISGGRAVKARNKASRELARCHFLRKSSFFLAPHARQGENEAGTMVAGIYSEKRISRLLVRRSRKCRKTPAWPRVERIRNYGRGGGGGAKREVYRATSANLRLSPFVTISGDSSPAGNGERALARVFLSAFPAGTLTGGTINVIDAH